MTTKTRLRILTTNSPFSRPTQFSFDDEEIACMHAMALVFQRHGITSTSIHSFFKDRHKADGILRISNNYWTGQYSKGKGYREAFSELMQLSYENWGECYLLEKKINKNT